MTPAGWIFMLLSWTLILGMFGYCMFRTLHPRSHSDEALEDTPPKHEPEHTKR